MRTIGVIPARWGSTRLPGKSLVDICGKPLIQWVVEAVRRAEKIDDLIVATDHERIKEKVEAIGEKAVMTRPDHHSGTDRIAEAIEGIDAEVVINIQGDEPLIEPGLIDELAELMVNSESWDMATAAVKIDDESEITNPSVVKVVWDDQHRALYFSRSVIPFVRDPADGGASYWRHLGIYAYRRDFLEQIVKVPPCELELAEKLEQLRALHMGARIAVVETLDSGMGVDTPEDVKIVEMIISSRK
ncbi:3-deoxy-D-manno-octulosonate cytidylyltransferase [bacterium E08(2017)]|nr:3-deoxy-D-manno-octulosonate cytidylyltransferase [bacterium E08(2017)]